ncbi:hypothetical protein DIPPA_35446 [Diplonema papillatum]|nr:hypothetical protein DIPPA_35446 [Diplonema papillatum]
MGVVYAEPVGRSVPEALADGLRRGFTDSERNSIYRETCVSTAERVGEPQALWILGPSACGKTSAQAFLAESVVGRTAGAVTVDGSIFRDSHAGWQAVKADGLRRSPPVLHKEAWDLFKHTNASEGMKKEIIDAAVENRQHLVIPDVAVKASRVQAVMDRLRAAGYRQHVVAIFAPVEVTRCRGEPRAMTEGKAFSERGFRDSLRNSLAIVTAAAQAGDSVRTFDNTTALRRITLAEYEHLCSTSINPHATPVHIALATPKQSCSTAATDLVHSDFRVTTGYALS